MALTIEQEQALLALLNEKKITLSELPAATGISEDDLMLIRQGILDKSVNSSVMKRHFTPAAASLTESGITKLSNAINSDDESIAATPKAVKLSYDLAKSNVPPTRKINGKALSSDITLTPSDLGIIDTIYPIGVVMFFAENKNPNTLFPSTTWKYVGEERTIRLGKMDGSDLNELGGADAVTLTTANIPAHAHSFSGTSSSFDYGTKTVSTFDYGTKTSSTIGEHSHGIMGGYCGLSSGNGSWVDGHFSNTQFHSTNAAGSHAHTVYIGAHNHTVGIGAHNHTVSGNTNSVGSGTSFNVTNAYVKLMGWYRTA
ncbi:phage tail protein [Budvicia aquatica]|uniref:Phage tail fibre repeat n=1 Tax=Budvicia aquatica TaxID=82979 RepID=A0A2C6DLY4_9GAMM|nr:phage tail protein [Budvicia aquatica]PHI29703.1 hypothetical protein CRN84_10330 [Budvicia aquatica]VFS48087.1 Phage tail fibre repeat [Budvicia aquatica]